MKKSVSKKQTPPVQDHTFLFTGGGLVCTFALLLVFTYFVMQTREVAYESLGDSEQALLDAHGRTQFPIGVDPVLMTITENPLAETYLEEHGGRRALASRVRRNWFSRTLAVLVEQSWYQNLASPTGRILIIQPGERKEQVIDNFGDILKWDEGARREFAALVLGTELQVAEGTFFPSTYVVPRNATPQKVSSLVSERFKNEVLSRYSEEIEAVVPLTDTLTIASLLEREAYDFNDMRLISGVIWNRLFVGMNLQLDASLQYAKATEKNWWPVVRPRDKDIDSPFNTYQHAGLPPEPIANPTLGAILAALNPRNTDCLFYFHDKDGGFHCSPTYEGHVALLKQFYGRGK